MTLTTTVAVHQPMPVREVYAFCRELVNTPAHVEPYVRPGSIGNPPGVGADALVWVRYHPDGPMIDVAESDEDDDARQWRETCPTSNGWAALAVCFDTPYSAGHDVQRSLVARLGAWLDQRGVEWQWERESYGTWHRADELDLL